MQFSVIACSGYVVLFLVWQIARWWAPGRDGEPFFAAFAWGAVALALCGAIVGLGPRPIQEMPWYELRIWLLKFYPFRLADVFVPLAASVAVAGVAGKLYASASAIGKGRRLFAWLVFAGCFCFALASPWGKRHPSQLPPRQLADWRDVCRWAAQETPADALFLAPKTWGFKWYGQRAEYVSFKDCPQDAAGVVEWNRRLREISDWAERTYVNGFSDKALEQLRAETGVEYLVVRKIGPFDRPPDYGNDTFRVYKLE
jgi:hypothetical protein